MEAESEIELTDAEQTQQSTRHRRRNGVDIVFSPRVIQLAERYEAGLPLFTDDELFQGSDLPMPRLSEVEHRVLAGCNRSESWD